jgi:RND family efflux transporter MFP subunit
MKRCLLSDLFLLIVLCAANPSSAQSFDNTPDDESTDDDSSLVIEGFTEPYRDIQIGSPDTAIVAEIRVDEGDWVKFGQVIAKLDDSIVRANMNVAREAAASNGELATAQLQLKLNKHKYEQLLELHGRNHATDQELSGAQATCDESCARVKAYEELGNRRRLELVQAEAQLTRMTIVSPIDGVVVKKLKDVGEIVSPADPHLLRVIQLDPLRISATASLQQSGSLKLGQGLKTTIGKHSVIATVEFVSPVADASSGTVLVQLRVANPGHQIICGLPCKISLLPPQAEQREKNQSIPRQTLKKFPNMDPTLR